MILVSTDIETTGLDPEVCQVIQLGMIIFDTENPLPRAECPTLNYIIRHTSYICNDSGAYALGLNSWIFDRLRGESVGDHRDSILIVELKHVWWGVKDFIQMHILEGTKIVLAGKNVQGFDRPFLQNTFEDSYNVKNQITPVYRAGSPGDIWSKFPHRVMDPGPMFALSTDKVPPDLAECKRRAGIEGEVTHEATDDCWDVIECIKYKWGIK